MRAFERLEDRILLSAVAVAPEFSVTAPDAQVADWSAVAADASGGFVVAWLDHTDVGGGIIDYAVYARRYDAFGQPLGDVLRVNTASAQAQSNPPAIAVDDEGDFVIAWESRARTGEDYDVVARRFNAAGEPQGGEFLVHSTLDSEQRIPAVAMDSQGNFVVAWQSFGQDGEGFGVFARRFSSAGEAVSDEIQVNTASAGQQHHAAIALSAAGEFVVTWTSFDGGTFPSDTRQNVYARVFAADATPLGAAFRVNGVTAYDQHHAAVATTPAGDFVVVWERDSSLADSANDGVYARRYGADGLSLGAEFRVSLSADSLVRPAVAVEDDGDFVVVWEATGASGETGVFGRWFVSEGLPVGGEFSALDPTESASAARPAVASRPGDVFTVTWTGWPAESSDTAILARQFVPGGSGVNQPPVLAAVGDASIAEETLFTITAVATDPEGHVLTYQLESGAPQGASIDAATGLFTWTPTEEQGPGVYSVTVRVTDNGLPALSDTATFAVTVLEVNQPPMLAVIENQAIAEGSLLTFTAVASDPDGNLLSFSLDAGAPTGASIDAASGLFSWSPSESQGPGTYFLTVRVADNAVPPLDAAGTFSVFVAEANQAPLLTPIGNQAVFEGTLLSLTASASDGDGDTLSFSLDSGAPAGATIDPETGLFAWTPTEEQGPGTHTVTIRVTDNSAVPLSAATSFQVTVLEVNQQPVPAAIGDQSIPEGILLQVAAGATDPDGDNLTFSLGAGAPAGAQIHPTSGLFRWTPGLDQGPGVYSITIRVTDDGAPARSAATAFTVTVVELGGTGSQGVDSVGLFSPGTGTFYLKDDHNPGPADFIFTFGPKPNSWTALAGDWNGDDMDTPGFFAPASGTFYLKDSQSGGAADLVFRYGPSPSGWRPVVGDWDGDGAESVGLFDPVASRFYLTDTNAPGVAKRVFRFGPAGAGWTPLAGDWDGDGTTTVGLFDPDTSTWYLTDSHVPGPATTIYRYGPADTGWTPLVGDWDGNGTDTVALFAPQTGTYYLKNTHSGGPADLVFRYGPAAAGWDPLVGFWSNLSFSIQPAQTAGAVPLTPAPAPSGERLDSGAAFGVASQGFTDASSVRRAPSPVPSESPRTELPALLSAGREPGRLPPRPAGSDEASLTGDSDASSCDPPLDLALDELFDEQWGLPDG